MFATNAKPGQECMFILDRTNFYPESGGQTFDRGAIKSLKNKNLELNIDNVIHVQGYSFHVGKIINTINQNSTNESFSFNDSVECLVDKKFRYNTTLNHTGNIFCSFSKGQKKQM